MKKKLMWFCYQQRKKKRQIKYCKPFKVVNQKLAIMVCQEEKETQMTEHVIPAASCLLTCSCFLTFLKLPVWVMCEMIKGSCFQPMWADWCWQENHFVVWCLECKLQFQRVTRWQVPSLTPLLITACSQPTSETRFWFL